MAEVDLKPVYLITGNDRPKVATALARLRRHFAPESVERVSALQASGADAVALCNSGSLFGDGRLVIVDDVDGRPSGLDFFTSWPTSASTVVGAGALR